MASKTNRTGVSETTLSKSSPGSLRVPKLTRPEPNTPSPTQHSRLSANSKPCSEKRSPKVPTPPEKTQTRKGVESQSRLIQMKEDLRKANELIASLEDEKAKALDELRQVRKDAEEVSEKLEEALKEHKKAEESFEIEKFEAVEAGIEAVQRKEEEMKKELESVEKQHASDSAALLVARLELERVSQELVDANDDKRIVQSQADDASKMAAIHLEKVEILSSELIRLKALLDSTREKESISNKEIASKLGAEIVVLKREIENSRSFEAEVKELEMVIERVKDELEAAKMGESYAQSSAEEWRNKAEEFEEQLEEVKELKRSALVSLASVRKELEVSNDRLQDMESEVTDLKERIRFLEESEERLGVAESEIETMKEEKNEALKKEQEATSSVEILLEEKKKLSSEVERSKEEEEKSKKAMESLASALQEVSSESRELKEKLLSQVAQVEDLKLVNKATSDKYEKMLEEARLEIDVLVNAVEQTKKEFESSVVDWEMREAGLVNHVKKFDEEVTSMSKEMNRLGSLVKRTKEEADAAWKKESEMRDGLKEVEDEVIYLQETLREARAESFKLNEKMLDKETEFQSVVHENDLLRVKHDDSLKKINELRKLLEEALAKKHTEEEEGNGEVSESEKDYDLLPNVVEFSEENGHRSAEEKKEDSTVEVEFKMWESCEIEKKEAFLKGKPEQEAPKEEVEETKNGLRGDDQVVDEKEKKIKKKTLFGKVGNLLKKKGPVNQR